MGDTNLKDNIENVFETMSFSDQYNFDIWITIIAIIIVLFIAIYFYILNTIKSQKTKWNENKCNPLFMPFASVINSGDPEVTEEYTSENFKDCLNNLNNGINIDVQEPISKLFSMFSTMFAYASSVVSSIVSFIMYLFNLLFEFFKIIFEKLMQLFGEVTNIFHQIMSFFSNIMNTFNSIYYSLILIMDMFKYFFAVIAMGFLIYAVIPMLIGMVIAGIIVVVAAVIHLISYYIPFIGPIMVVITGAILASVNIPFVIITAFFIFLLFLYLHLVDFGKRIICNISPSSDCPDMGEDELIEAQNDN